MKKEYSEKGDHGRVVEPVYPGKHPRQVAHILARLYNEKFGGKKHGRYRILRSNLLLLSSRATLPDVFLKEIVDELMCYGYILISFDAFFCSS